MSILDAFSLKGKVALVTGGAGLYGRQIVEAVAEAEAKTYVASRNLKALEKSAEESRQNGLDVVALQYDQGDEASILALRDEIIKRSGKIDILINNSVARTLKDGWQSPASAFEESMRINATGLFLITRAIGDVMGDEGSIINIGSIMGLIGPEPANYKGTDMNGFVPDYFFNKGGMASLTRCVASYYGEKNIRCNCIHPGGFYTGQPEPFVERYCEHTMLGRMANETDLKGIIVFLASDASAYITGTNIPVDAGYTAK